MVEDLGFPYGVVGVATAVAMIWLSGPLELGLEPTQMILLAITEVVTVLTVVQGRAYTLQGFVHLVLLTAFLSISVQP